MTRNDYCQRILFAGGADGPSRFRFSDCFCNFTVGFCFSERNFQKFVPDCFLKFRSWKFIFQFKSFSFPGKIFKKLFFGFKKYFFRNSGIRLFLCFKVKADQFFIFSKNCSMRFWPFPCNNILEKFREICRTCFRSGSSAFYRSGSCVYRKSSYEFLWEKVFWKNKKSKIT